MNELQNPDIELTHEFPRPGVVGPRNRGPRGAFPAEVTADIARRYEEAVLVEKTASSDEAKRAKNARVVLAYMFDAVLQENIASLKVPDKNGRSAYDTAERVEKRFGDPLLFETAHFHETANAGLAIPRPAVPSFKAAEEASLKEKEMAQKTLKLTETSDSRKEQAADALRERLSGFERARTGGEKIFSEPIFSEEIT